MSNGADLGSGSGAEPLPSVVVVVPFVSLDDELQPPRATQAAPAAVAARNDRRVRSAIPPNLSFARRPNPAAEAEAKPKESSESAPDVARGRIRSRPALRWFPIESQCGRRRPPRASLDVPADGLPTCRRLGPWPWKVSAWTAHPGGVAADGNASMLILNGVDAEELLVLAERMGIPTRDAVHHLLSRSVGEEPVRRVQVEHDADAYITTTARVIGRPSTTGLRKRTARRSGRSMRAARRSRPLSS